jgi:hypothetical protein
MPGNRNYYSERDRPHARDRNMVVFYGARGASQAQLARKLRVGRTTMRSWAKKCPKFADALKKAHTFALAYWEEVGERNIGNSSFNTAAYIKIMTCRFWRDYQKLSAR